MIKWALLGWLSSSLTDQLIRLISSRANCQSLHHHHAYKQTSEAQVNQVIFNRSPPPFWNGPVHSKVFLMFLPFCIQIWAEPRDPINAQKSNLLFSLIFWFLCCGSGPRRSFFFRFGGFKGDVCKSLFRIKIDERFLIYLFHRLRC